MRSLLQPLPSHCRAFVYERHGDPESVLRCAGVPWPDRRPRSGPLSWRRCGRRATLLPLAPLAADAVAVQMLAAPVNPADINQIQGVYPVRPPLPAVAGNEGVGVVVQLGPAASTAAAQALAVGDLVIPRHAGFGALPCTMAAHRVAWPS